MKKGMELVFNTIVIMAVLLIVAVIIIFVFQHYYGKETGFVGEQIDQLGDCDGDGISNMLDKCPCDADTEECITSKKDCQTKIKEKKC